MKWNEIHPDYSGSIWTNFVEQNKERKTCCYFDNNCIGLLKKITFFLKEKIVNSVWSNERIWIHHAYTISTNQIRSNHQSPQQTIQTIQTCNNHNQSFGK